MLHHVTRFAQDCEYFISCSITVYDAGSSKTGTASIEMQQSKAVNASLHDVCFEASFSFKYSAGFPLAFKMDRRWLTLWWRLRRQVKTNKEKDGFPLTAIREVNILLSFHHAAIVEVSEVVVGGPTLDSMYMVMEFMEHDLKQLMEQMRTPFSIAEVLAPPPPPPPQIATVGDASACRRHAGVNSYNSCHCTSRTAAPGSRYWGWDGGHLLPDRS